MPQDFTKKRPIRPPLKQALTPEGETKKMQEYIRDLNLDGMTLLPGKSEPEPMVGLDPNRLKEQFERNIELKNRILRDMAATWKCLRCGREQSGKFVRVRVLGGTWKEENGRRFLDGGTEVLVCRYPSCGGEVIKTKDPYRTKLI